MKNFYTLFLLLLSAVCFSQQLAVRGLLADAVTHEPVIAASVGIENSRMGTITNEEGVFQLSVSPSQIIVISCIGYKTHKLSAADFGDTEKKISLEPSEEVLEEVMVTKIPLTQVLQDVIVASKARFNKPVVLHTYYREFVKVDGKYKKFSDGLLDYHASGDAKKTKSDLIVKQNRSFSLTANPDEEDERLSPTLNVQYGISNSYSFEFLEKNILKNKNVDDYDFTLKSRKNADGSEWFAIIIEPKREVEASLFEGHVIYDPKTKLVYEYDLHFAPSHKQFFRTISLLGMHVAYLDKRFKAVYKMTGNNYELSYNNRFVQYKTWTKKFQQLSESRSDLIVTNFEKDDLSYNKKEVYKKKYLYDKPTHMNGKFWQKNNAIVLTAEEEKIIDALEKAENALVK